jgi:uncharacterized membrane protein
VSTVRFVATAFRWIIELLNVLFALLFGFSAFVYIFNREAILGPAASLGYRSEFAMITSFLLIAVIYIVFMGLLCVILEIWESLKRLEAERDHSLRSSEAGGSVRTQREPRI